MSDTTHIINLQKLIGRLDHPDWIWGPQGNLLDRWRFSTQHDAVANIKRGPGGWINTGQTRQSLTSERDPSTPPVWALVGSNLLKARWGEYGTGLLSEDPSSSHRRYFPPPKALDAWAKKHGFASGWVVSLAIYRKGGTEPRRFLRNAFDTSKTKLPGWLATMSREIEANAGRA